MSISAPRMNGEIREEELELKELLSTSNGFERYAAEKMSEFIQVERDYEGFVRDVIVVTEVTAEDLVRVNEEVFVVYSKDVDAVASTIARHGEAPTLIVKGTTVKVTFFPLTTPRLTITQWDLDTQPYDIMKRTQERAGQAMAKLEDQTFLEIVDQLILQSNPRTGTPTQRIVSTNSKVKKSDLLALKKTFSQNNVAFSTYLMHPATYDDFLDWGQDELDPFSQRTVLETGQLPTIWGGLKMVTGLLVPENKIYGLAPKEILGRMPVLRDVTIEVQRVPQTQDKEIMAFEYIGMFIHDMRVVSRVDLGDVTPPTAPTGLTGISSTTTVLSFYWNPSTDDSYTPVTYIVEKYNAATTEWIAEPATRVVGNAFNHTGTHATGDYVYRVIAVDAAGNKSPASNPTITLTV
jgi:hypothetical protein